MNFNPRTSCEVRPDVERMTTSGNKISIHAPRVRCDVFMPDTGKNAVGISIHAPRVRCDRKINYNNSGDKKFQSTHLV